MKLKSLRKFSMRSLIMTLIFALTSICANASETVETLTFAWEHDNPTLVTAFELHLGVTAGGPYALATEIPNELPYESPTEVVVTGDPGTTETRYFVLRACGDVPLEGGGTEYQCSDWSNEVSYGFWLAPDQFKVPVNFRIISQ
jgi:hypothetical protein